MVENIQKQNMKKNSRTVIDLIIRQGRLEGKIPEEPKYKVKFAALWSLSDTEKANVDKTKADTEYTKAQTSQIYMDSNVLDPSEVRKSLASEGDFEIEEVLSEEELNLPEDTFDVGEKATVEEPIEILGQTNDEGDTIEIDMPRSQLRASEKVVIKDTDEIIEQDEDKSIVIKLDGGPGSGDWGHSGRPGKIGGSGGGGGKKNRRGSKEEGFTSAAKEKKKKNSTHSETKSGNKPAVKSPKEFDEYVKGNELKTLHRGYSAPSKALENQYAESIKNGTSRTSSSKTSGLGEGLYFTSSKEEAEGYMNRRKSEKNDPYGRVTTVALKKGSKIADWEKLNEQKARAESEAAEKALKALENGASKQEVDKLKDKYNELRKMSISDYAVSEGYDASYHAGENTTIVYNQNALVVRDDSLNEDGEVFPAAAVIIIKDGKILCASRRDNEGVCGPGGHVEEGEEPEDTAIREAMEEFNIAPLNLQPLGEYKGGTGPYLPSMVYWTDTFSGTPEADGDEMLNERWMSLGELREQLLYPPFETSLDMLENLLKNYLPASNSTDSTDAIIVQNLDGGSGSGNFGHRGRPGKVGGSGKGGGKEKHTENKEHGIGVKEAVDRGVLTSDMKNARKNVKISNPNSNDIKAVFEDYDALAIANKYVDKISKANQTGDYELASILQEKVRSENDDNLGKRLKKLGTYMEDGYYVSENELGNPMSEVFLRDSVNTSAGCFNMRSTISSSSRDDIAASHLGNKFVKITADEAKSRLSIQAQVTNTDYTFGGISSTDESIIKTYTYATAVNSALRNGTESSHAQQLHSIIDRTTSPERTVYRGIQGKEAEKIKDIDVGGTYSDKGFMSTSYNKGVAESFAGDNGVVLKITTAAGYGKSFDVSTYSMKADEEEVLLNAGSSLKIVSKHGNVIECEMDF